MRRAVFFLTSGDVGRIVQINQYDDATPDATITADAPSGTAWIISNTANITTDYVTGGAAVLRPTLTDPVITEYDVEASVDTITIPMPSGTLVTMDDGSEYTSTAENFVFTTAIMGEWTYAFAPPWPYVSYSILIICSGQYVDL